MTRRHDPLIWALGMHLASLVFLAFGGTPWLTMIGTALWLTSAICESGDR